MLLQRFGHQVKTLGELAEFVFRGFQSGAGAQITFGNPLSHTGQGAHLAHYEVFSAEPRCGQRQYSTTNPLMGRSKYTSPARPE